MKMELEHLRRFWGLLKADLCRAFRSHGFWLGAFFSAGILLYGASQNSYSNSNAVHTFVYAFVWGNVVQLFFLADSMAFSASFASDWQSGFYRYVIARSRVLEYALSKCITTAISSGASVVTGCAAFIIFICIISPEVVPDAAMIYSEIPIFEDFLYADLPLLFFFAYLFIIFMQAAFFGVLGLCISGYFPNKYVAYVSPFVLGFTANQLANALGLPASLDPVKMAMGRLFGVKPAVIIAWEFAYFTLLIILCSALFIRRVKRRIANA